MKLEPLDLFNYSLCHYGYNAQIACALFVRGSVDADALKRAVVRFSDAEEVLMCRIDPPGMRWIRTDEYPNVRVEPYTDDPIGRMLDIASCPIDACNEPMLQIYILPVQGGNWMFFRVAHACCDAGGLLYVVHALRVLYGRDEAVCSAAGRGLEMLFESINDDQAKRAIARRDDFPSASLNPAHVPWHSPFHAIRRCGPKVYRRLRAYGATERVNINHMLMAAFLRAQRRFGETELVSFTSDGRKYLRDGMTAGVCNYSSGACLRVPVRCGESFGATVRTISSMMKSRSDEPIGLPFFVSVHEAFKKGYGAMMRDVMGLDENLHPRQGVTPVMSNIGLISRDKLMFGDVPAEDGFMLGPGGAAPVSLMVSSCYNENISVAMGGYEPASSPQRAGEFLEAVMDELTGWV